jgi:hypothetical protein
MSKGGFKKKSPLEVFRKNVHWRILEKMYAEGF